ncbi:MAG: response regulator [Candidatus Brocadiae bacterium]|nr:response regulator [Candidatus Brocadiia bacterium]
MGATPPPSPHSALLDLNEFNRVLAQAQRLEAVARLSAGVAHDFNNLLTVIIGLCEVWVMKTSEGEPIREDLLEMRRCAERVAELTRHLSTFARARPQEARRVQVADRCREMERLISRLVGEGISLRLEVDPKTRAVVVDSGQFDQVLVHLAARAGEVMTAGGKLSITCGNRLLEDGVLPDGEYVQILVQDSGPPLSGEEIAGFFDSGASQPGSLTRLGPGWCREFARQYGGDLLAEALPEGGSVLRLLLPAAPRTGMHPAINRDSTVMVQRGSESVLLLEDDDGVRRIAASALRAGGYRVIEASNPDAALAAFAAAERDAIQLLVTDILLPGISGPAVFRKARMRHPELRVVYVSGYAEDAPQVTGVGTLDGPVLAKPFSPPRLLRRARAQLDSRGPSGGARP